MFIILSDYNFFFILQDRLKNHITWMSFHMGAKENIGLKGTKQSYFLILYLNLSLYIILITLCAVKLSHFK